MNRQTLAEWARPLLDAIAEIERAARDTVGDASMLATVDGLVRGLPDPDWSTLADEMALAMEVAAVREVQAWQSRFSGAIQRRGTASFAAENPGFAGIEDAVKKVADKTPVASALRSDEWKRVPLALRERAQFSSRVESIRLLSDIQSKILARVSHEREMLATGNERYVSRDSFIRDIRQSAIEQGLDTGKGNVLTNIAAPRRIAMIYDMQNAQAAGYARWKLDNDPDALAILPAWRLGESRAKNPRQDWIDRWTAAGSAVGWQGAAREQMVALKTSPIWRVLSRFGTPWPPFDFGSTRELEDVWRDEAERLGLIQPDERIPALAGEDFNAELEASVTGLPPDAIAKLLDAFGNQVEVRGDRIAWRAS